MLNPQKKLQTAMSILVTMMTAGILLTANNPLPVQADAMQKPYLALGADLKTQEKQKVLELLHVDGEHLEDYELVTITNAEEHEYLDDYLSSSIIGSRALSSVYIDKREEGEGIDVTTYNITYCTKGMYENALTTAGVMDARVVVAGPFDITGTAALVGAMKAYEDMTGEDIDFEKKDAATNELVLTGVLAEELQDSEKAEQFIALVKEEVIKRGLDQDSEINDVIEEGEKQLGITFTEEEKQKIVKLMKKITSLDLNVEQIKKQAKDIYQELKSFEQNHKGFFQRILDWIQSLMNSL